MARVSDIFDTTAEAGIIATLIYHPTYIFYSEQLKHTHFYNKESACLYWGIGELVKQGVKNIDAINLTTIINSNEGMKNTFDKFGINLEEYIELAKEVKRDTVEEYMVLVNRVLALAYKRELHKQLQRFDNMCLDLSQDNIGKINKEIYETLNRLNEKYVLNDDIQPISNIIDDLWQEIEQESKDETAVLQPKIPLLRNYFTYSPGEVIMLVARYKRGKSAWLMNEALYQAEQGHVVAYFDTEMSTKEFIIRALANLAQVEVRKIKQGSYSPTEEAMLKDAINWLKTHKIIHKYKPEWKEEDIYTAVKMLQYKYGVDFLVFDYIKSNDGDANTIYNKLGKKADYLKNIIAGQLQIPVLTASQLNRNGEIADSDKLARYVSTVMYWKEKSSDDLMGQDWQQVGNYTLQVRVNRLGEQMLDNEYINCVFNGNVMTITQAPVQPEKIEL